jgi:hypothetical protein
MDSQIVCAEDPDGVDVTEEVLALAGPDGNFHGVIGCVERIYGKNTTLTYASDRVQII